MQEVHQFILENRIFYLASVEGDQPRVRPFGAVAEFEGKLYLITNNQKAVYAQLQKNPKLELSATSKDGTAWLRVAATAAFDPRREAQEAMLAANPGLSRMYSVDDGKIAVFYLKDASATFTSFGGAPRTVRF